MIAHSQKGRQNILENERVFRPPPVFSLKSAPSVRIHRGGNSIKTTRRVLWAFQVCALSADCRIRTRTRNNIIYLTDDRHCNNIRIVSGYVHAFYNNTYRYIHVRQLAVYSARCVMRPHRGAWLVHNLFNPISI